MTILVVLILLVCSIYLAQGIQRRAFEKGVKEEARSFLKKAEEGDQAVISEGDLMPLPAPVARWLKAVGVVGAKRIETMAIEQEIQMRLKPDGSWLRAEASQLDRVTDPGFLWLAKIELPLGFHISGRDLFQNAKGHMWIKPLSLFTAVDAKGMEIDEGSMQRFLGEMVWMPTLALEPYITWESEGPQEAKATMSYKGVTVSGRFYFDAQTGLVRSFRTLRYYGQSEPYELRPWEIPVEGYEQFGDFLLPAEGRVIWQLPEGPYEWFRFRIKKAEANKVY